MTSLLRLQSHFTVQRHRDMTFLRLIDDSFITRFVSGLTNDEVVAQVFMLYLAGHENTANTLTFVSYELSLNQEVQDRVIQEIQDQIGEVIHRCTCSSKLLNLR